MKEAETRKPESIAYRVQLIRKDRQLSQAELADKIGVPRSQISRLESSKTPNVSAKLAALIAKELHVSTDYLLGLTSVSVPKNYDISALGLSEKAVRQLLIGKIDAEVLNRLMEHDAFPHFCTLIRNYFDDTTAQGILARNELIDLATGSLAEVEITSPEQKRELMQDRKFLQNAKLNTNEADIEKIRSVLMTILRKIKEDMHQQTPTAPVATKQAVEGILAELKDKPRNEITANDMANAMTAYVQKATGINEEGSTKFMQLAKWILLHTGRKN